MRKTIRSISNGLNYVSLGALMVMVVLITVSVIGRKVFNRPILGDVELVECLMVVVVMMGLAYTQAAKKHVAVGILVDRFSPRTQAIIDVFNYIVAVVMLSLIVWQSGGHAGVSYVEWESTNVLRYPLFWFRVLVPIGYLAWILEDLIDLYDSIRNAKKKGEGRP